METSEEPFLFAVNDRLFNKFGCKASWGIGNELLITAGIHPLSDGEGKKTDLSRERVDVNVVTWDTQFHDPSTRKLINEARGIFLMLQNYKPESSVSLKPQMVKFSREYRAITKACIEELQQISQSCDDIAMATEINSQMQMLSLVELVWNLCELLFVEMPSGGTAVLQLMEWMHLHFVQVDSWVAEAGSSEDPENSLQYWNAVYGLVLQGRVQEACRLLSLYSLRDSEPIRTVCQLMTKMPVFAAYAGHSLIEFELRWQLWHDECEQLLEQQHFTTDRHAEMICRILCGEEEVFEELRELLSTWYVLLISRCFYTQPTIKAVDIHYHSKFAIDVYGGPTSLQPFDYIILAALEFDIHKVIKDSSFAFGSSWFPAHLCDLLFHCGRLNSDQLWSGSHIREHLLLDFADSLMSHPSLWQVAFDYLDHCEQYGRAFIEHYCDHLPVDNERKVEKLLYACDRRGLSKPATSICRTMGMRALKRDRLGKALCWAVRSKDIAFVSMLAEKLLLTYAEHGDLSQLDLLDTLGDSILMSPKLMFLSEYRKFHMAYEAKNFKSAGQLLLSLLTARIAPQSFLMVLLTDALPLLQAEEVIFDSNQTYEMLHCLEELTISNELEIRRKQRLQQPQATKTDEKSKHDEKVEFMRLALAKNLARAIVHEGFPIASQ